MQIKAGKEKTYMTPEDVKTIAFPKARFGGYDMTAVDRFLKAVEIEITSNQIEINYLRSKMVVLVNEIERLRNGKDRNNHALCRLGAFEDEQKNYTFFPTLFEIASE